MFVWLPPLNAVDTVSSGSDIIRRRHPFLGCVMRDEKFKNMGRVRIYMNPIARIHTEQHGAWRVASSKRRQRHYSVNKALNIKTKN